MKAILLLILTTVTLATDAQILCIKCYDQNARVLSDTNNLILNGGFENSSCIAWPNAGWGSYCPNANSYNCDITNWTCIAGGTNTYASIIDSSTINYKVAEGSTAAYFGNAFSFTCTTSTYYDTSCIAASGCQTYLPNGYPVSGSNYGGINGVSLLQTVNGLTISSLYSLEFWTGGEWAPNNFHNSGIFGIDLGFGNILLRNPSTPITGIGRRYVISFIATSNSHTFKFTNWGHTAYDACTELVLDDVRLYEMITNPCTVGMSELDETTNLNVYPNPVFDKLNVSKNNNEFSTFLLYDNLYRKLLQQTFTNSTSINTEQLAKGIYIYVVIYKNGVLKKGKFIKN